MTQFIESVDAGQLCMLIGACMDGLVETKTPPALPMGLVTALSTIHSGLLRGASNDACDVCKVWGGLQRLQLRCFSDQS